MLARIKELSNPAVRKLLFQALRDRQQQLLKIFKHTIFFKWGLVVFRVLKASYLKFLGDDCFTRANTIAYSVVMSIIPLLTVLVKYAEVDQDLIRANIARFMVAYGITDTTEVLQILDEILGRANEIAGIGLTVMIFTAANLLRHLEDSFNLIFKSQTGRPYLYRFAIYIASIVVLPGILILTGGTFQYFLKKLNPPDLISMARHKDSVWIIGTDGLLRKLRNETIDTVDLARKVDTRAPYRNIYFDFNTGKAGYIWDISRNPAPPEKIDQDDFLGLIKIVSRDDSLYIISRSGVLFYSHDGGVSWRHNKFAFKQDTQDRVPIFEDIAVVSNDDVLILFSIGTVYYVIRGSEHRWSMSELDSVYGHIIPIDDIVDSRGIFQPGIYMTGNGRYLYSPDEGKSWIGPFVEKFGHRSERINAMTHDGQGDVFFAGSDGSLWIHRADGIEYAEIWSERGQHVTGLHMNPDGTGFLYGEDGLLRFTRDAGRTWLFAADGPVQDQTFFAHLANPDGSLMLGGENESLLLLAPPRLAGERSSNGLPLVAVNARELSQYPVLKSALLKTLLYFLLYLIVLSLFLLVYKFLPNVRVHWSAALIAAFVTSLALLIFAFSFRTWITSFANTGYIYGVWAIVPVGMIVILTSAQITLFGLEIAYVLQHPHLYRWGAWSGVLDKDDQLLWNSITLVTLIYRWLYAENRPLTNEAALPYFDNDPTTVEALRERLADKKLFAYDSDSQEYFPVRPPNEILIKDIYIAVFQDALKVPVHKTGDNLQNFKGRLLHITRTLITSLEKSSGNTTVLDLLKTFDQKKKPRFGSSGRKSSRTKTGAAKTAAKKSKS